MKAKEQLEKYGIRPSVQRLAIMDYLLTHKTHPTVDDIYSALYQDIPTLSKTTVYNTLKLFADHGAALSLSIEEKNVRFDGDTSIHAHFRCSECGEVFDFFPNHVPELLMLNKNEIDGFSIAETQVYFKGFCKSCSEKKHK